MTIDLRAYLARIAFPTTAGGALPPPTLETLRELHRLHPQAIPFENLDPLRGVTPALEPAGIEEKLVHGRRGGYCFEHNLLLREVLLELGYRVRGLAARVVWNQPPGAVPPRGHMLLLVGLGAGADAAPDAAPDLIADVGFGGQVLTGPLRLHLRGEQPTPHEPFRIAHDPDAAAGPYTLESLIGDTWHALYRFDLTEQHPVDYVAANFFLSRSPASHFTTGLIAARTEPGRRFALRNGSLAVHRTGGPTERTQLASARELRATLEGTFGIALPADPALDAALERLATPPAA